ncbi:MAG: DUF2905 domain-containing protein [Saprospiraceae bacterium]|nr:DUF2905 domain-containing protein [Saprospiraceae bacterium]
MGHLRRYPHRRDNFKFCFPLTTMVLFSIVINGVIRYGEVDGGPHLQSW